MMRGRARVNSEVLKRRLNLDLLPGINETSRCETVEAILQHAVRRTQWS
jgi:hypothetical protein